MPPDERAGRRTEAAPDPRIPRVRSFRLEVMNGPSAGSRAVSKEGALRIGTGPGNDLVLPDRRVSAHHLELETGPQGVWLKDLHSTNGTEVDGYRTIGVLLRAEARIRIGDSELWYAEEGGESDLPVSDAEQFGDAIGVSRAMRRVFAVLERAAPTPATILLEGESGTGKEVLARGIHAASPRAKKPFVVFDCSATTPSLVESALFGHVRGAFTGATGDRAGVVDAARGGTLFLDEIGELPPELQPKLLGVLERRTFKRVGDTAETAADVRVVAATNRDLRREVNEGQFRADLWHRLAVIRVVVPPLRQRPEDVVPIARRIAEDIARRYKLASSQLPAELAAALLRRRWTGNVRELRNHLERALAAGLPDEVEGASPQDWDFTGSFHDAKDRLTSAFEKAYLQAAIDRHGGNLTAAAREAGLSRMHVQRLVKRYGIVITRD